MTSKVPRVTSEAIRMTSKVPRMTSEAIRMTSEVILNAMEADFAFFRGFGGRLGDAPFWGAFGC